MKGGEGGGGEEGLVKTVRDIERERTTYVCVREGNTETVREG